MYVGDLHELHGSDSSWQPVLACSNRIKVYVQMHIYVPTNNKDTWGEPLGNFLKISSASRRAVASRSQGK